MYRLVMWRVVICTVLALAPAPAAWADYEAGRAAWKAERHGEALTQWRAAARTGDRRAMLALGRAFVKGLGVAQDYAEAHKWFNLAAARGDAKALAERDALEKRMTIEERAEARRLARAWRSAATGAAAASPPPRALREAQRLLAVLGYEPGPADGVWRQSAASAYSRFLREAGREPSGRLTPAGLRTLRRKVKEKAAGKARVAGANAALRATAAGDVSALEKALAAGADPNARGRRGWTPLMHAATKGYTLLVPPLLKAGAKPNLRAADGATALFIAALHRQSGIIAMLMKAGADPTLKGPKGKSAEEVAHIAKNPRVLEALGLIETIRDSTGMLWKGAVLGGKRHGRWTKTDADGVIVEEGPYVKGEKHGRWKKIKIGGMIEEEGPYVKGKKHGRWKELREDRLELGVYTISVHGEVHTSSVYDRIETGPYVKGERHGRWTLIGKKSKDKFRAEGRYVKGKKNGEWKLSSRRGHWKAEYRDGEMGGLWEWKSRGGTLKARMSYRKSKLRRYHMDSTSSSNPCSDFRQIIAHFDDKGLLHGDWMYHWNKYNLHIVGKYVRGKKHGWWTREKYRKSYSSRVGCFLYFDDGDVEKVYYENGKRVTRKPSLNQAAGNDTDTNNED